MSGLLASSRFHLNDLLQEVVRSAAYELDLKGSAVRLVDAETGELVVHEVFGLSDEFISMSPRFSVNSRFCREIADDGVLQVEDIVETEDLLFADVAIAEGIRSLLAVGLYRGTQLIGSLSVYTGSRHTFSAAEIESFRIIANQVSVAINLARLHEVEVEKERMESELDLAAEIQQRVLPEKAPLVEGFEFACRYTPWEQVGGDFYDFIELPGGNLGIVVGDVSGKGVWAALLSFVVRTAVRAHAEYQYGIGEIISRVNQRLFEDTEAEQFATLSYATLNLKSRMLTYVTALCPPPVIVRDGMIVELDTEGLAVGILPHQSYDQAFQQLEPGDLVVMYSDGYSEVFNRDEEMFGDERLHACILKNRHLSLENQIQELENEIEAFLAGSGHGDDRTLVMVSVD